MMMYHFFYIGTYSPQSTKVLLRYVVMYAKIYIWAKWDLGTQSTKVLLRYVVMYAKIYIWAKWDLGTLGESIRFCKFIQILFKIGWISLNGTAMQRHIEVSLWP